MNPGNLVNPVMKTRSVAVVLILLLASTALAQTTKPAPAPLEWRPFLGEYVGQTGETLIVLEKDGKLVALKRG